MLTLASIANYIFAWQVPLLLLLVLAWLWGGSYYMRRLLRKEGLLKRTSSMARPAQVNFLGYTAGLLCAGLVAACVYKLGNRLELPSIRTGILAAVSAGVIGLSVTLLAMWALLAVSLRQAARILLWHVLPLLGLLVVMAVPAGYFTVRARFANQRTEECRLRLGVLSKSINDYLARNPSHNLPPLEKLMEQPYGVPADYLRCPAAQPGRARYLYIPNSDPAVLPDKIRLVDLPGRHGANRYVVFADRLQPESLSPEAYATKLNLPVNAEFKKLEEQQGK